VADIVDKPLAGVWPPLAFDNIAAEVVELAEAAQNVVERAEPLIVVAVLENPQALHVWMV
jgi:hypothetical protein